MRGESLTFEEFLAARLPALSRYATALAGDPDTGADVLQDVLLKAQPRWSRIAALEEPEAYVRRMVINELVSARRRILARRRRESTHVPAPVADGSDQRADRDALVRLVRALPARQRADGCRRASARPPWGPSSTGPGRSRRSGSGPARSGRTSCGHRSCR
ncbi:hypothetical protein [Dactylosporangium sp. NPDC049140]|uniref:hypothetical protein n=1 Tax=Dactylosporangium sp. NPDC049140 TaxID=3155647 RepID=UPI0033F639EC